ncbi:LysR family transcriptional regulator [Dyella tabacisoli]|uniref:LysR family transcriptional regulator n=1 Tax=Dyella tabacisoli TaxID=2282381 RepID=A0A369UKP7_9GAMM|nr:LysR family transcriptional regulator [Dyella tabacisoli]RDD81077.1 LysR family transcriptional regulator [Dyella tabacisoli]
MHDLNDLYFFTQVVDYQGFAPAGRALGIPKSKLSRRIALLEERLGARLIQRSSRRFSVTDIGLEYYQHCKAMLIEAEAAQEVIDLRQSAPQGVIRLTCPVAILHARVGQMLADYMAENPKVTIQLESTNRRVDVIGEGVDMAIRVRPPPLENSDLVMRVLAERGWRLVGSPALIERLGLPHVPADLHSLPTVDMRPALGEHIWELDGPEGARAAIRHEPRMVTDDMIALRTAAIRGIGVTQLPSMIVCDEIKDGSLLALLPEWAPKHGIVHVVFPSRRGVLPAVRTLIDFLVARFAQIED